MKTHSVLFTKLAFTLLSLIVVSMYSACSDTAPLSDCLSSNASLTRDTPTPFLPSPTVPMTDELTVDIDTSLSMAGFVSPNANNRFSAAADGQTIYSKTLLELRNVVNTFDPQLSISVRHVDTGEGPRLAPSDKPGLAYPATYRSLYSGTQTNLVGAFKSFAAPVISDQDGGSLPRFHILITDGVQSTEKEKTGSDCFKGSDAGCVKKEIQSLLSKNWQGTILGIRSEFDGLVYSENAPRSLPREKRRFQYSSGNQDPERYRPFYLYIFSPDKNGLEKLVESLKQGLRARSENIVIREYGLTTDYTTGNATVSKTDLSDKAKNYLFVQDETQKAGDRARFTVSVSVSTADLNAENKLYKRFSLRVIPAWSSHAIYSNASDIARSMKWKLVNPNEKSETEDHRYPYLKVIEEEIKVDDNAVIEVPIEAGWLPNEAGPTNWREYRLIGRLDNEKGSPPWVAQWSAEDDQQVDSGNRTLNLLISLANLWKNRAVEDQSLAEVRLCVGK